jgi:TPR repeat protein
VKTLISLLILLSCARALAADGLAGSLSTANFKQCPQSLWPSEKEGQILPGVTYLRVYLGTNGKVQKSELSTTSTNSALERAAQMAVLGCAVDVVMLSRGAGWYDLRYVWGLLPSIKGLEREAIRELMDDAVNGDVESQLAIYVQYRSNKRFVIDASEAFAWLVRSTQTESADAQLALAIAYGNGDGVAEDQTKATIWYGRAAQAGNSQAQYLYGVQLEFGIGVKTDVAAAISWYRKAATGGSAEAKKRLLKESP